MRLYTTWLPLFLTALTGLLYILMPVKPAIVGPTGLIGSMLTLISTLPGFYFAGLAAVATFANPTMDREMPDPAPEVLMLVRGQKVSVPLTRRLFLSYLFSYLVVLSLGLCLILMTINGFSSSIRVLEAAIGNWTGMSWPWLVVKGSVCLGLTFSSASMVISTLHGVFFLTEKIHQP